MFQEALLERKIAPACSEVLCFASALTALGDVMTSLLKECKFHPSHYLCNDVTNVADLPCRLPRLSGSHSWPLETGKAPSLLRVILRHLLVPSVCRDSEMQIVQWEGPFPGWFLSEK